MKIGKPTKSKGIKNKTYDVSYLKKKNGIDPAGNKALNKANQKYA